jgi:hypothetical protein
MKSSTNDEIRDDLPMVFSWNGDGTVDYITVTNGASTWKQQFTYSPPGTVTNISGWVKQ